MAGAVARDSGAVGEFLSCGRDVALGAWPVDTVFFPLLFFNHQNLARTFIYVNTRWGRICGAQRYRLTRIDVRKDTYFE